MVADVVVVEGSGAGVVLGLRTENSRLGGRTVISKGLVGDSVVVLAASTGSGSEGVVEGGEGLGVTGRRASLVKRSSRLGGRSGVGSSMVLFS